MSTHNEKPLLRYMQNSPYLLPASAVLSNRCHVLQEFNLRAIQAKESLKTRSFRRKRPQKRSNRPDLKIGTHFIECLQ